MPYVDNGQNLQDIGHCRTCKGQWVVTDNIRGKKGTHRHTYNGRKCPYCDSANIYYSQEDNR